MKKKQKTAKPKVIVIDKSHYERLVKSKKIIDNMFSDGAHDIYTTSQIFFSHIGADGDGFSIISNIELRERLLSIVSEMKKKSSLRSNAIKNAKAIKKRFWEYIPQNVWDKIFSV